MEPDQRHRLDTPSAPAAVSPVGFIVGRRQYKTADNLRVVARNDHKGGLQRGRSEGRFQFGLAPVSDRRATTADLPRRRSSSDPSREAATTGREAARHR